MKAAMIQTNVTYSLAYDGKFYLIEHVPARVCRQTGEQYFALETVKRIQALIHGNKPPNKTIETHVYAYA